MLRKPYKLVSSDTWKTLKSLASIYIYNIYIYVYVCISTSTSVVENLWVLRRNRATTKYHFLVILYNCACAIHVRFFEITTNAWGEKCSSVHLKFAMVESKLPGYIHVFYSSFFPIPFNCFLFAFPFPFFFYVWSFAETNFPRMEVKSGILASQNAKLVAAWAVVFSEKKSDVLLS